MFQLELNNIPPASLTHTHIQLPTCLLLSRCTVRVYASLAFPSAIFLVCCAKVYSKLFLFIKYAFICFVCWRRKLKHFKMENTVRQQLQHKLKKTCHRNIHAIFSPLQQSVLSMSYCRHNYYSKWKAAAAFGRDILHIT